MRSTSKLLQLPWHDILRLFPILKSSIFRFSAYCNKCDKSELLGADLILISSESSFSIFLWRLDLRPIKSVVGVPQRKRTCKITTHNGQAHRGSIQKLMSTNTYKASRIHPPLHDSKSNNYDFRTISALSRVFRNIQSNPPSDMCSDSASARSDKKKVVALNSLSSLSKVAGTGLVARLVFI